MKRWYAFVMMVVMLAPILFIPGCVSKGDYEELQGEFQRTKEEVDQLESTIANLDSLLSDTQEELASTREELASTKAKLEAAEEKLNLYKETGIDVFSGVQPPYSKTSGFDEVDLINNKDATNPTWEQLMAFLFSDKTDQKDYSLFSYPCGAFAEEVHNNAEAAGTRSAWVAIEFEGDSESHALNAFNTIEKGLVFVDCTSAYRSDVVYPHMLDPTTLEVKEYKPERLSTYDKIAYVVAGKEYGCISLDVATSPEYSFYESYLAKWEEYFSKLETYNQEVNAYNQDLGGRVYLAEPEYSKFKAWYNRLDSIAAELEALLEELGGFYWEPMGVVSKIEIYL